MKVAMRITKRGTVACLCLCLALPLLCRQAEALSGTTGQKPRRAIIVNAEQPNVWTLEQAHYLLAQMHRRNLDLKAKGLAELDPNGRNSR
jgi:hypothetical protein